MSGNITGLVVDQSPIIMGWVAEHLEGCQRGWSTYDAVAIGVAYRGQIIAGVVYHDWNPEAGVMELTIYSTSPRWATRKNIFHLLQYAFIDNKCQMVVTRTSASNERNIKMMRRLGFEEIGLKRLFGRQEDGIIFSLTDDDWKTGRYFMGSENGQVVTT